MEYIIEAENTSPRKLVKPLHLLDEWVIERFFLAINQRKIANRRYINPDIKAMQKLNKIGLVEMGFPYYGWLISIQAAVVKMAAQLGISLIFYGEEEVGRFQANIMMKMEATRKEVQGKIDEIIMDAF